MICWSFFPRNRGITPSLNKIIDVFEKNYPLISSDAHMLERNEVLKTIRGGPEEIGYTVEKSKRNDDKIRIPVLFGERGKVELAFEADGYSESDKTVIEVEAGRAVVNNQFLKDFFQACMMLDVEYLCIAVRQSYSNRYDYSKVCDFFNAMFASGRITTSLKGILIIEY